VLHSFVLHSVCSETMIKIKNRKSQISNPNLKSQISNLKSHRKSQIASQISNEK
jgi:hypothetical protein